MLLFMSTPRTQREKEVLPHKKKKKEKILSKIRNIIWRRQSS